MTPDGPTIHRTDDGGKAALSFGLGSLTRGVQSLGSLIYVNGAKRRSIRRLRLRSTLGYFRLTRNVAFMVVLLLYDKGISTNDDRHFELFYFEHALKSRLLQV